MASARCNPFHKPVRETTVRIQTGKVIRLVTNDLDAPAREIADHYKQRWQIELFFKWIKRNLKIRYFMGNSENAVRIQIFVAPRSEATRSKHDASLVPSRFTPVVGTLSPCPAVRGSISQRHSTLLHPAIRKEPPAFSNQFRHSSLRDPPHIEIEPV
ncbi:transposase [Rhizobium sp. WYJ-E13]|nr:transposase [Rhizobium sp. WYJ-E13]